MRKSVLTKATQQRLRDTLPRVEFDAIEIKADETVVHISFMHKGERVAGSKIDTSLFAGDTLHLDGFTGVLPVHLDFAGSADEE